MIFPSIEDLAGTKYNRYELVIAVAKGARKIIDELNEEKEEAHYLAVQSGKSPIGITLFQPTSDDADKDAFDDEKAVKVAVQKIFNNEYKIQYV